MLNKLSYESKVLSSDIQKKELAPEIRDLMGSRDFQIHILYYHFLVMTYRNKIILPDGFRSKHIIIKVLDYVIGDFKGQLDGKPTRCSATRLCLVLTIILKNC